MTTFYICRCCFHLVIQLFKMKHLIKLTLFFFHYISMSLLQHLIRMYSRFIIYVHTFVCKVVVIIGQNSIIKLDLNVKDVNL